MEAFKRSCFLVLIAAAAPVLAVSTAAPTVAGDVCAYVANSGADYVTVIDAERLAVVATIDVGGAPRGVAVDPNGRFVYVTDGERLWVVSGDTYEPVDAVQVRSCPTSLTVSADGSVAYVVDACEDFVSIVDLASRSLIKSIQFPLGAKSFWDWTNVKVAASRDGGRLYAPLPWGLRGGVAVVDVNSGAVVETIPFLPDLERPIATGVVLAPDDRTAYVLLRDGFGAVPILDVVTASSIAHVEIPPHGTTPYALALAPDGGRLYVASDNGIGRLHAIDTSTKQIGSLDLGVAVTALAVTPDGHAVFAPEAGGSVLAVDTSTLTVTARIPGWNYPRDIAVGRMAGPCRPADHTPRPTPTPTPTFTLTPTKAPTPHCPGGTPCLQVGSTTGPAGGTGTITVTLTTAGAPLFAIQNDLVFDPRLQVGDCRRGPETGSIGRGFTVGTGWLRAILLSSDAESFGNPHTLYTCTVSTPDGLPPGAYPLLATQVVGSDVRGQRIDVAAADGSVEVIQSGGQPLEAGGGAGSRDPGSGGCHIGAAEGTGPGWRIMLLGAAGVCWCWRRRHAAVLPGCRSSWSS